MNAERQEISQRPLSPEAAKLKDWLRSHGIKAVLFDLDDTLLDTHASEQKMQDDYVAYVVGRLPQLDTSELRNTIMEFNEDAFHTHSVTRERWHAVVAHLTEKYGQPTAAAFYDGKKILSDAYNHAPELLPGAIETLSMFRQAADKMGVVTHADKEVVKNKLDQHKLRKYFDTVTIADPFSYKGPEDWKRAIDSLQVKPSEALVIGDNVTGDIQAANFVGVKFTVLLPTPWEVYSKGVVPQETIRANSIRDVIGTLLQSV